MNNDDVLYDILKEIKIIRIEIQVLNDKFPFADEVGKTPQKKSPQSIQEVQPVSISPVDPPRFKSKKEADKYYELYGVD
jgi:hypothetical protein